MSTETMSEPSTQKASRSSQFRAGKEPFQDNSELRLQRAKGPFSFLNPTRAEFHHLATARPPPKWDNEQAPPYAPHEEQAASDVRYNWTSRNNRKGRHELVVDVKDPSTSAYRVPEATNSIKHILVVILRMFTSYPVWDISWLVAYLFLWGSIIWVLNGFFVFLPEVQYNAISENTTLYGGGITAFIGATVFEVGSVFLMLEAINENQEGCFGWAVKLALEQRRGDHVRPDSSDEDAEAGKTPILRVTPDIQGSCHHHHPNKKNLVGKALAKVGDAEPRNAEASAENAKKKKKKTKSWIWYPSWHDLTTHYFHELGFIACFAQLIGATIFWIAGFTALPGIYNKMSQGLLDGVYWTPQVVGAIGFVISGTLFMVETQSKWWVPNPWALGWHIGLWNLVGGVGFTLSPIFGYFPSSWGQYEAACSTFWGSWAFLIGSAFQLYESLEKSPVTVEKPSKPAEQDA